MSAKVQAALVGAIFLLATVLVILLTPRAAAAETSVPVGHFEFCKERPAECAIRTDDAPHELTEQSWLEIEAVNKAVNVMIEPMRDIDLHGVEEKWTYPVPVPPRHLGVVRWYGDCEDYVLEKRRRLSDTVGLGNALITIVRQPDGTGHAVLTIRTSRGELILDNLRNKVLAPDQTGYKFLKRQAHYHTGRWVSLQDAERPNG